MLLLGISTKCGREVGWLGVWWAGRVVECTNSIYMLCETNFFIRLVVS